MARKRAAGVVDLATSDDSDDGEFEDIQCSQLHSIADDSFGSFSDTIAVSEDDCSSDNSSFDKHLYEKCLKDYRKIRNLKRNLEMAMYHKSKKMKCEKNANDGFTRFSVKAFMSVISALSPEKKQVINSYGFGSLLLFNKCFVPNKFAQWVARLVDSKSGDIVHDGKVISLTEESVHLVLDLPVGRRAFPSDPSVGKKVVLSKFEKERIPPISFFVDKLTNRDDLSDEDMFVCFMVVALSYFLCPNTNSVPSPKYFGIFEDIHRMKEFNGCGFVLDWLLDHVKAFNRGKNDRVKHCQGLGGCIYYLVVVYLDHIDFRKRQVEDSIPRIAVWKENMIQYYSNLDLKSPGVYGYRPLLDFEKTCYYKSVCLCSISSVDELDVEFCGKMDDVSGCKLPLSLKLKISKLIDEHSFNCGLSVNMDVNSLRNVSKEFQDMFAKLMHHVCSIDVRTKDLVLDLMKAIAETDPSADDENRSFADASPSNVVAGVSTSAPRENGGVSGSFTKVSTSVGVVKEDKHIIIDLDDNEKEVKKNSSRVVRQCSKVMPSSSKKSVISPVNANVSKPLADISNEASRSAGRWNSFESNKDVILIDKENVCVPDSVSPSPVQYKPKMFTFKRSQSSQNDSQDNRDEDYLLIRTLSFSDEESPNIAPQLSSKSPLLPVFRSSIKKTDASLFSGKESSPVVCVGSKTFSDKLKEQAKKSDLMYNSKLEKSGPWFLLSVNKSRGLPSSSSIEPEGVSCVSKFIDKDSTTGGKLPLHGPRRLVCPSRVLGDEFVNNDSKFKVSKSEIANYNALCALAKSRFRGVRGTFWSLGESLKPGGQVNNFVVAAFCYHLFCHPDGHPDEYLLKDNDDVASNVMLRAFNRSAKARPLPRSNLLYFPTCYEDYWFLYIVDIKDRKFVFLDSLYNEDHAYQQYVSGKMIPEFQFWWDKFVMCDMKFNEYDVIYPSVPKHSPYDDVDSGVYTMMFLEHWTSPRSSIVSLFTSEDIPSIRMKLANDMVFNPRNSGNKNRVISYDHNQEGGSD